MIYLCLCYASYECVYNTVWDLFTALHDAQPEHDIFKPVEEGHVCAPYIGTRAPGVKQDAIMDWQSKSSQLATTVAKYTGDVMHRDSCWMGARETMRFRRTKPLEFRIDANTFSTQEMITT